MTEPRPSDAIANEHGLNIEWAMKMLESALRDMFNAEQIVLEKRRLLARAVGDAVAEIAGRKP